MWHITDLGPLTSSLSLIHLMVGLGLPVNGIFRTTFSPFSNVHTSRKRGGTLIFGGAMKTNEVSPTPVSIIQFYSINSMYPIMFKYILLPRKRKNVSVKSWKEINFVILWFCSKSSIGPSTFMLIRLPVIIYYILWCFSTILTYCKTVFLWQSGQNLITNITS